MRGPGGWLRRTRWGLIGALACLLPAAAGHVAAGEHLPGTGLLAVLLAALAVPGAALSGSRHRWRFEAVVTVLGLLQITLHHSFHRLAPPAHAEATLSGWLCGPAHAGTDTGMAMGMGMGMGMEDMAGMPSDALGLPAAVGGHGTGGSMAAWHTLATTASALCLIHGERVLRRLARPTVPPRFPLLVGLIGAPFLVPERPLPPSPAPARCAIGVLLARSLPRRGPPAARA
ncbi:hypothetical protein RMN57_01280 [Kitasatospora sp. CM 4170]|uniref:Integral membrane protein n=1 Tax=Kitasatospora aburaviensis TaxID=67265 RepID=A0ABW1F6V1_9ACTN|nr:hypothetical protein [Kitasatospora sp. CM 4170]WNM43430.1 hypothetical protein RMN57_01280 [Kitasatospora sp. CM 4170]